MEALQEKPPFVVFSIKAVEDREKTIASGRFSTRNEDFATITPHGSRDRIERNVADWFTMLATQVSEGRFPAQWLEYYENLHKRWKASQDEPATGTWVRNWPAISPAQVETLLNFGVSTVEALAEAKPAVVAALGSEGPALQERAKAWLDSSHSGVAEELAALRQEVADLKLSNAALLKRAEEAENVQTKSVTPAPKPL